MKDGSPRILIIQFSAIGDVVRVLPAMHALRDFFPSARIDWAVERKSASVLLSHPTIDELHVFERDPAKSWKYNVNQFRLFLSHVRGVKYDIVIDFHGTWKSGYVSFRTGARERYVLSGPMAKKARRSRGGGVFGNRRVQLESAKLNRVEENLKLIEPLAPIPKSLNYSIYVPPEVHDYIEDYFDETFSGGKLVVGLHAPMDKVEKRWPLKRFAELADMLLADGRFEVMLTFGPHQQDIADEVQRLSRRKPELAPETKDLRHYAWLIHRCDLYVGGDTGPMHIAAAVGTPVVAVFGGTEPTKHRPYRLPSEIVYAGDSGGESDNPMSQITGEMVYDACVRMLAQIRSGALDTTAI